MKKTVVNATAPGTPSAIMIFVILLLTCFAALTYTSARADDSLSKRTANSATAYYEADAKAQEALMRIDEALLAMPADEPLQKVAEGLNQALDLESKVMLTPEEDALMILFPYGEYRAICVEFTVHSNGYSLQQYSTVLTQEPDYDEDYLFDLWDGSLHS